MMNRRDFFRVVAASGATAAASGCQRATETILPLVVPNEQIVPGVAAWFATVCRECPGGCGVIAKNREGRVVKLEGNPDHPVNQGALCARGQAALQGLYHPDRFTGPRLRDGVALKPVPWDAAQKVVADKLADLRSAAKGQAIALVTQLETSSLGALLDKWTQALGTRPRVTFEPFAYEALRAANRITFGRDAIPYFAFEDAEVVLSFGADFLRSEEHTSELQSQSNLVCRLLLEKKKKKHYTIRSPKRGCRAGRLPRPSRPGTKSTARARYSLDSSPLAQPHLGACIAMRRDPPAS